MKTSVLKYRLSKSDFRDMSKSRRYAEFVGRNKVSYRVDKYWNVFVRIENSRGTEFYRKLQPASVGAGTILDEMKSRRFGNG